MYIGVDVGTGSARACLMDESGELIASVSKDIKRFSPKANFINQSSADIWASICHCTKACVATAGIDPKQVKGIAFDATCSLVVVDKDFNGIGVGPNFADNQQDVILWMDHRAGKETDIIKKTNAPLLKYVGGQMSIEMEIPKVLWLKNNMDPKTFAQCSFYDLPDYLTARACGAQDRSFCSTVCKQGYVPIGVEGSETGWNAEFLTQIGLGDLCDDNFSRLGGIANKNGKWKSAGEYVGELTSTSAEELGLSTSCAVGSGVIDAYSGWVGTVAAKTDLGAEVAGEVENRLAAVAGTSTCHIVLSRDPVFVPGVWGPYKDVLVPGMWAAEGGQSTTGELLHHILTTHPAHAELSKVATEAGVSPFEILNGRLEELSAEAGAKSILELTKHLFVYGDMYGNRSPLADPNMRGSIVGLGMDVSLDNLALTYLATVEFICLQTRQIIEAMNSAGHKITSIYLSGGQCRNKILTSLMATATGMPLVIPKYIDSAVVFGTAVLAAMATTHGKLDIWSAMGKYSGSGTAVRPNTGKLETALLDAKYEIFLDQLETQQRYRTLVEKTLSQFE